MKEYTFYELNEMLLSSKIIARDKFIPVPEVEEEIYGMDVECNELKFQLDNIIEEQRQLLAKKYARDEVHTKANLRIGRWLSAALDDENVCQEMKDDINYWLNNSLQGE